MTSGAQAPPSSAAAPPEFRKRSALLWAVFAAFCFHAAQLIPFAGNAIMGFFVGLMMLTRVHNARHGFRWGIVLGWMVYVPHLAFFWKVFLPAETTGIAAVISGIAVLALWMVLPIWLGLFLSLATWLRHRTRAWLWVWLIPMAWTGIEYFRSELYPLKFSWLSVGYAFSSAPWLVPLDVLGTYGLGFLLLLVTTFAFWGWPRSKVGSTLVFLGVPYALMFVVIALSGRHVTSGSETLQVGGVQLEFPTTSRVLKELDRLIANEPEIEICVLSEYTFDGPVPDTIRNWCRDNGRYLIAGGKAPVGKTNFYNTAFVIGPDGEQVFNQVKSVPIQFFRDGLPAPSQQVWDSPWGRIGLCICYDLGYRRVTDGLVGLGAQAIIAPTMDVESWGAYQHRLHARIAPIRAAEYGIPIFRLTSSGISQNVRPSGKVTASRPYPGQGEVLTANLSLPARATLPLDHWLAPLATGVTAITAGWALLSSARRWFASRQKRETL